MIINEMGELRNHIDKNNNFLLISLNKFIQQIL